MNLYGKLGRTLEPTWADVAQTARRKKAEKMEGVFMGVDPGPTQTAYALVRPDYSIVRAEKTTNEDALVEIANAQHLDGLRHVAIEGLACYGRPVGRETFETAYMVGRVMERCRMRDLPWTIYNRPEYANAIAGTGKVTDAMLFQALRLRFGGTKTGEPLHALKGESDLRSAYAVACYWLDCQKRDGRSS